MFNQILLTLLDQKNDYLNLKEKVAHTPLEKLINNILERINIDNDKIITLNQIEYIL